MFPVPLPDNIHMIYQYLCNDRGAYHVANFPLIGGTVWSERKEKNVHRDILNILAPLLCQDVHFDAIILPDSDDTDLVNILSFMYGGRWALRIFIQAVVR